MRRTKPITFKAVSCFAAVSIAASSLAGCILVPEAAPLLGHEWKKRIMFDVIRGVQCEIRWAVKEQIRRDQAGQYGKRKLAWFENWNALIDLNLQIEDSIAFNPGISLKTPNLVDANVIVADEVVPRAVGQSYNFGFGGGVSYTTSREDKVQFAYPFGLFVHDSEPNPLSAEACYNIGGVAINSNLKIYDWLDDVLEPVRKCAFLGAAAREDEPIIPVLSKSEVALTERCYDLDFAKAILGDPIKSISHKITFKLTFNANATPSWNLVRIAAGGAPRLFDANRRDTSELLMTFGPPAAGSKPVAPIRDARTGTVSQRVARIAAPSTTISQEMLLTHNALQIGSAVRDALQ